ncbi:MAG: M67 family metallopeptidase [Planctomycetes bacterium]|nr:M67 family metallopeptidase [Planctomycetota bacterium]
MTELEMPASVFDQMVAQARAAAPIESCGILAGGDNRIEQLYEMTNIDKSPIHFAMDPAEQFAVVKKMRAAGLKMLAIYHSHPLTPARLSEEDQRLALTPDVAYLVLSLKDAENPYAKVFVVDRAQARQVPLTIVKG